MVLEMLGVLKHKCHCKTKIIYIDMCKLVI